MKILSVNAGSSSLKFQMYEMPEEEVLISGVFERIGLENSFYTIKINGEKIKSYSIAGMYKLLKEKENINCKEKTFKESVRRALNTGSIYYGYSFVRGW